MPRRPIEQIKAGNSFFAKLMPDLDISHFAPLWHLFTVGHLITTDLDALARRWDCSFADLDLLGTLAVDEGRSFSASDMASALYVSKSVVSIRVARLARCGLLSRVVNATDRRAYDLILTTKGRALVTQAVATIEREASIARLLQRISPDDQAHLARILGDLHDSFDREFVGTPYRDG